ncbi:sulfite exporter TauE/SafE family protein [Clostridium thermosuccinogenes]|uniref:urease accessory protein UreH domain-containing protein n=1 Tax=Clostridium thermosuccinogenes TaxID=84032 RepID=UPI000CA10F57|nr:sulfite exporter TauE/SafE family protein [Pseudoclostridium thermosuccinogenes]AUS97393.1 heavy metal transporter [Pseudoclostridium thermosuccinogenes]
MEQRSIRKILQIDGMTCTSCEMRIENALRKLDGVLEVKAIFSSSNVYITYDANVIGLEQIIEKIEKLDYIVKNKPGAEAVTKSNVKKAADDKMSINQLLGIGIILFALYVIVKNTVGFNFIPEINQSMGYGILFFVGLLTSLHCIAMCGGINLSQCVSYKVDNGNSGKLSKLKPSLLYNSGRVISYTIIGGIVGSLGSGISFSGAAKGIVAIISGVFMVIMGLNMLNIFPWLRKLNPRMPKIFGNKIHNNNGKYGPFYVGLLNGLMPCGPLQSMQIYALGTGSFAAGALSMFMFSIGTVPLMFGFGAVSSVLSGKFTHKMMKVSAVLVIVLGVVMTNRGLALSGFSFPSVAFGANSGTQGSNVATIQNGIQIVTTNLSSGSYEPITVQKGIPVRWTIKAQKGNINGCNNEIVIPKFNTSKKLEVGDNIIEFTPTQTGTFAYSCWMGMIRSKITVVDDINNVDTSGSSGGVQKSDYKIPTDEIAVAKLDEDGKHYVEINLEENRFSPAVIVMQKGIETIWNIKGVSINDSNSTLIFPKYNAQINMQEGDNEIGLIPVGDFDFSTADNTFYGYVKVVDDINEIDIDAIKNEINQYVPTVQEFIDNSGLPSCH